MDDTEVVDEFLAQLESDCPGPMGMRLYSDVTMWQRSLRLASRRGRSRHEEMVRAFASLVALANDDLPGSVEAIETIWAEYVSVIGDERDAAAEADHAIASAIRKYSAQGSWWERKEFRHET